MIESTPGGSPGASRIAVDLVLPIYNEADGIVTTIEEWFAAAERAGIDLSILACEDGSSDGTRELLESMAATRSIRLITGEARKGYSLAVVDGLRASTAEWVCCADGDGQCDPAGLAALVDRRGVDHVVVGIRAPRRDPLIRRWMSAALGVAFFALHRIRLEDPSSPYCLMAGSVAHAVAVADPVLPQGYWWEFHIRRHHLGVGVVELNVPHRQRTSGVTRVYLPADLPRIALVHLRGLWTLRNLP